ncbi:HlyD family efflux transporter periplasmic adaptor subunit [Helicobacter sp. 13S00477-4]|uniref:efflux RND transporter periplasmic adaptor subunit n=1 Tax=Helicobacter sp. 13S00477-4 TaxID=1905759 RepID=UPI000BA6928A|nr:HlyD family efflux transporter periplasmic adaptor subunit [Helicobacter sp. 13S00477-4]PAF51649.1 efflux transporter periplasmic adaptor subunit [Helicobacter sp. 13S00477-4]
MKVRFIIAAILSMSMLWAEDIYAIFNIEAVQDANLTLDTSGIVSEMYVDVDSIVKKGDKLLVLANKDKLAQADSIHQQYVFAKKQYERYSKTGGAIDKNTLDKYYFDYKKLEADYAYYISLLDKSILKAPFDGVIASRNINLGDGVSANSTTLFRLVSHQKKMVLEYDSKYIDKIKIGDEYTYSIDGGGDKKVVKITKIYPTIDESTRKVTAEAIVPDDMVPGIFGDGYIRTK